MHAQQGLAARHDPLRGRCILLAGSFTNTSSKCQHLKLYAVPASTLETAEVVTDQ